MRILPLVSVAEFITVRFQRSTSPAGRRTGVVSVAEFITVRFQQNGDFQIKARRRSFSS